VAANTSKSRVSLFRWPRHACEMHLYFSRFNACFPTVYQMADADGCDGCDGCEAARVGCTLRTAARILGSGQINFSGCYHDALDGLAINGWVFNPHPMRPHFVCSIACLPPLDFYAEWWFVPGKGRFELFVVKYKHVLTVSPGGHGSYARNHGKVLALGATIHDVLRHCCCW
jgi:hypothetical protein